MRQYFISDRETHNITAQEAAETLAGPENSPGVLEGNYMFSSVGSPETQTAMTTELEQAAAFCSLLQQLYLDHAFLS